MRNVVFNDTATTEIYTLSLHDALPIYRAMRYSLFAGGKRIRPILCMEAARTVSDAADGVAACACALELIHTRSEEHTSELPSCQYLVCRLLLEQKTRMCLFTHASRRSY